MVSRAELTELARTHRMVPITRTLFVDPATGEKAVDHRESATGADLTAALDRIVTLTDELAHWQQVRAEQLAAGQVQEYGKATIGAGDTVLIGQHWWQDLNTLGTSVLRAVEAHASGGKIVDDLTVLAVRRPVPLPVVTSAVPVT